MGYLLGLVFLIMMIVRVERMNKNEWKNELKCECGKDSFYSEIWDAYYCLSCNKWITAACKDPYCEHCHGRPERPFKDDLKV